jgi:hypothetical protein
MRGTSFFAPLALAALLGGGCHFVGATVHNLDELHTDDGLHERSGRIMTPTEWALRDGLLGMVKGLGANVGESKPKSIKDPVEECVEQVNELASFDDDSPLTASIKVEYLARISAFDPWNVSRTIAVRELGDAGRRLALSRHPEAAPAEGSVAGPEQVRDALQALIDAASEALDREDEGSRQRLAAACQAMAGLPIDVAAGTRVLRSLNILLRAGGKSDPRLEPLRKASIDVQRKLVWAALERALSDPAPPDAAGSSPGWPDPRVKAAAVEANISVWGDETMRKLLDRMAERVERSEGELESEPAAALLRNVARRGLPKGGGDPEGERRRWTEAILAIAGDQVDGTVRVAAMSALGRISGKGRVSLREEDWQAWWLAERPRGDGTGAATPGAISR